MIKIQSRDGKEHSFRHVSVSFREVLRVWQRLAPEDRVFCAHHGLWEQISTLDPSTIVEVKDRVGEIQRECERMEIEEREAFAAKMERDKARFARCNNKHGG